MVINGAGFQTQSKIQIWARYNFDSFLQRGYPQLSAIKAAKNPVMDLTEGLYAQALVWTGDPSGPVVINKIGLEVQVDVTAQQ